MSLKKDFIKSEKISRGNFSIKFFKFLGIVFLVLYFGAIQIPKVEASSVGDYLKIKLDIGAAEVYEGYASSGTADTFEIPAGTTFYQPGATRYECALLLTEEDILNCDDDGIVWVKDGAIIGQNLNSLSTDITSTVGGAGVGYVQCCDNGSPACAKDGVFGCGNNCNWVEAGGNAPGADGVFGQNQVVVGWKDQCGGINCDPPGGIYSPPAGAVRNYEIMSEYLCAGTWQLCDAPGTCFSYGGKNYACDAVNYWKECSGATPNCVAGACEAAATCDTDPTVEIIPVSQNGVAGTALNYTIKVTNNDDAACAMASRTFNLSSTRPGGWPPDSFSAPNVTAAKGDGWGSVIYTLTSPVGAAEMAWNFTITASDASGANTANGTYTVTTCDPATIFVEFDDDKYKVGSMLQISYASTLAGNFTWCIYDNIGNFTGDDDLFVGPQMDTGVNAATGSARGIWTVSLVAGVACPAVPTGCIGTTKVVECLADADCASLNCDLTTNTCAAAAGPTCAAGNGCLIGCAPPDPDCGAVPVGYRSYNDSGIGGFNALECSAFGVDNCSTLPGCAAPTPPNPACWNATFCDRDANPATANVNACCNNVASCATDLLACNCGGGVCNNDTIMNNGETGVDCGGGGCPTCCGNGAIDPAAGEVCDTNGDIGCAAPTPVCQAGCGACVAAAVPPSRCDPDAWVYCNPLGAIATISAATEEFLGYALGLIGSVALLFIIVAGLMYMTSAGSEDRIATSKRILTGAVIGLGVALLAYSLLQVIITVLGM